MTFDEFMTKVLEAFPDSEVEQDNEGQLIVYTDLLLFEDEVFPRSELGERELRQCDGCGTIEDAGTFPDQDGGGRSECCWWKEDA